MVIDNCFDFELESTTDSLFDPVKPEVMDLKSESWFTDCDDKRGLQTPVSAMPTTDESSTLDAISEILFESETTAKQSNLTPGRHCKMFKLS